MTSSNKPKNWSDWNNTAHFSDYSRNSRFGKTISYAIATMILVPVVFLIYMMSI